MAASETGKRGLKASNLKFAKVRYAPNQATAHLWVELGQGICFTGRDSYICCKPSIRIIDVYGSECTIVFQCSDSSDGGLWIETDYPLSNLNYNEAKVRRADDGIKSDYYSQRFTVRGTGIGSINPVFWIIDLFSVFTIVFIIVRKVRAKRNS